MKYCIAALLLGITAGCATERDDIDSHIRGLGTEEAPESSIEIDEAIEQIQDGDYECLVTPVHETKRYDEVVAMAVNSESTWPGAILPGHAVHDGIFTQVPFQRQPLTMSISLSHLDTSKSFTLTDPKLSSYRNAIADVLSSEVTGSTPANLYAEIEQVHSEEQLGLALGLAVKWLGGSEITGAFDWNRHDIKSRYLVKYTQAYYTVDVDLPYNPSDFFANSVTVPELEKKLGDSPPVYISSITHGRLVVFTFESQFSSQEVNAALSFAYRGGVEIDGGVSLTHQEILDRSNITAYILGGSGEIAAQSIDGFDSLMNFIGTGGNFTHDSPGAPIAYKLSHLADNTPARFSLTNDYYNKTCQRTSQKLQVTLESITVVDGGTENDLEIYGTITAEGVDTVTLLDKSTDNRVHIQEGTSWPQQGAIADEVVGVTPAEGEMLRIEFDLWDHDGLGANDPVGVDIETAPYELGWRRQITVPLTGSKGTQLEVSLRLQPI